MKWIVLLAVLLSLMFIETAFAAKGDTRLTSWALASVQAEKAQETSNPSDKEIVVAIIDTGIDLEHEDLKDRLWTNPGEIPNNKIDDDKNGYIDDVHGWNFAGGNDDLRDRQGHGTHISGIIAGAKTGLAPNTKIMVLKYYDPHAVVDITMNNVVNAIEYAIKMKAKIINFSAGGKERNPDEERVIRDAGNKGILFVAAAGNERSNSDVFGFFPADYDLPNILCVAAISKNKNILAASNFGRRTVDLAAPGEAIISTYPGGGYELMSGTSQATAFATAAASLLLSQNEKLTPQQVVSVLSATGERNPDLLDRTRYAVQINSYRSLVMKAAGTTASGLRDTTRRSDFFFSPERGMARDSLPEATKPKTFDLIGNKN
jgi:thermitase